jgi:multicomponent Na+:H+ antiporter subunit D
MAGIGKRMPVTMAAFAVASAGMAGIPLVAGFVSKWYLLIGSVEAGEAVFAAALLVSGMLNIAYFWPVVYQAFFESADAHDAKPLVESPYGGDPRADGGDPRADGGSDTDDSGDAEEQTADAAASEHESDDNTDHDHADHTSHDHHGGPPPGGWDRRSWLGGESTWFVLGPILVAAAGALALGIAPTTFVFLRIVEAVAANVGVVV